MKWICIECIRQTIKSKYLTGDSEDQERLTSQDSFTTLITTLSLRRIHLLNKWSIKLMLYIDKLLLELIKNNTDLFWGRLILKITNDL